MAHPFVDLLEKGAPLGELAQASDALTADERLAMKALYERAEGGSEPVALDYLVPDETPKGHTVEWLGKNSLPMFSAFSKRFTRNGGGALTGHNTGSMQWLVGPGYFTTVVRDVRPAEFLLDYTRYPQAAPNGWPALKRNEAGISRLVFYDMHDYLRPVGRHLAIGAAYFSNGKFRNQYFTLTRGPVLPIGA
ncbi:MAG: hypothetical protein ACK4N5_11630 [Myxococcales bacterium]